MKGNMLPPLAQEQEIRDKVTAASITLRVPIMLGVVYTHNIENIFSDLPRQTEKH